MRKGTQVVYNKNQLPLGLNAKNDKEHLKKSIFLFNFFVPYFVINVN